MRTPILLRLASAVPLFLLVLLPLMVVIGVSEGTDVRPGLLFWLLSLLPLLLLPWLWSPRAPEDTADAPRKAMPAAPATGLSPDALAEAAAPLVDVERRRLQDGVPVVEGRLRADPSEAFARLERALAPAVRPLFESTGGDGVRVVALPSTLDAVLRRRSAVWINLLLFAATVATTVFAGALHRAVNLLETRSQFAVGNADRCRASRRVVTCRS